MNLTKFRSNEYIGVKVPDLEAAKTFYTTVLGFELKQKEENYLIFDTGHFLLCVSKGIRVQPPVPSFTVSDFEKAKKILIENGCEIVDGGDKWLWFKDPFGIVYDIIEKQS